MARHSDLVKTFGGENVVTVNAEQLEHAGVSVVDVEQLAQVGLPRRADGIYTLQTVSDPQSLTVHEFVTADGETERVLVLGGVPEDERMRYFLSVNDGYVGMFTFNEGRPEADVINSTLADFIEFLRLLGMRDAEARNASPGDLRGYTEHVSEYLRERDDFAFEDPDSWWPEVFRRFRMRD